MSRITITQANGDERGSGDGYVASWSEDWVDGPIRKHALYPTLDELFTALLFRFEGRYDTQKVEREYWGRVVIERGPIKDPDQPPPQIAGPETDD